LAQDISSALGHPREATLSVSEAACASSWVKAPTAGALTDPFS